MTETKASAQLLIAQHRRARLAARTALLTRPSLNRTLFWNDYAAVK
jgi:hypothetical protein